jgi:hypothetical protein
VSNKDNHISELFNSIKSIISCNFCNKTFNGVVGGFELAEGAYTYGWRADEKHTYCSKCYKKRGKKK